MPAAPRSFGCALAWHLQTTFPAGVTERTNMALKKPEAMCAWNKTTHQRTSAPVLRAACCCCCWPLISDGAVRSNS
jgi:hypothetical protein